MCVWAKVGMVGGGVEVEQTTEPHRLLSTGFYRVLAAAAVLREPPRRPRSACFFPAPWRQRPGRSGFCGFHYQNGK